VVFGRANKLTHTDRLGFLGLSTQDCSAGSALWAIFEPKIDDILEGFYEHLSQYAPKSMFQRMNIPRLSQAQKKHWNRLFTNYASKEYLDAATAVAEAHDDIGLSAEWYIGGYTFLLNEMTDQVLAHYAEEPQGARNAIQLLNRLVGLDIGTVMSVYQYE